MQDAAGSAKLQHRARADRLADREDHVRLGPGERGASGLCSARIPRRERARPLNGKRLHNRAKNRAAPTSMISPQAARVMLKAAHDRRKGGTTELARSR